MSLSTPAGVEAEIGLLDGWRHVNPHDAGEVGDLAVQLDERLRVIDELASGTPRRSADLDELVRSVIAMFRSLGDAGVVLYAWWAAAAQDHGVPKVLMAAATLAVVESAPVEGGADRRAALTTLAGADAHEGSSRQIPRRSLVELAGGTALRVRRSRTGPNSLDTLSPDQVLVQYLLPVNESSSLAILTFATPAVRYADQLQPVFDSIASTLKVTGRSP